MDCQWLLAILPSLLFLACPVAMFWMIRGMSHGQVTRNLVRLLDGTIEVESTPGKGSSFSVWLPQKAGSNPAMVGLASNGDTSPGRG